MLDREEKEKKKRKMDREEEEKEEEEKDEESEKERKKRCGITDGQIEFALCHHYFCGTNSSPSHQKGKIVS